jgi:uncharacterized protein (TIGR02996 family)
MQYPDKKSPFTIEPDMNHTAEAAFIRALQDDPADETSRLVFADWLDERGDRRGEFLRVQQELSLWVPDLVRRTQLQERQRKLLDALAEDWLGPLRNSRIRWHFENGLAHVTMKASRFLGRRFSPHATEWFRQVWLGSLRLTDLVVRQVPSLAGASHLAGVPGLELGGNGMNDSDLARLIESPHLGRLRRLDLSSNQLTDQAVVALAASDLFSRLQRLDLRNNPIEGWGLRTLLQNADPSRLRWLALSDTYRDERGMQALVAWRERARAGEAPAQIWNSLGMAFVRVPAGTFHMGSPRSESSRYDDEDPCHPVTLTRPFYLGAFAVTQRQFGTVMGANPSLFGTDNQGGPNHPVETVSWEEAEEFCRLLGEVPEEKARGHSYRLPTEAEWEHACRAGTTTPFFFGSELTSHEANFDGNYPYGTTTHGPYLEHTAPGGSYRPNAFGLYDMHGNVWEWCSDWYAEKAFEPGEARTDPTGPREGHLRVLRGGSWFNNAGSCRAAYRYYGGPAGASSHFGFRVVLVRGGRAR